MDKSKNTHANSLAAGTRLKKQFRAFMASSLCVCLVAVFVNTAMLAKATAQSTPATTTSTALALAPTNAYECTQVSLEQIDPALLTKEERVALLDGSLKDSIDNYSTCVSAVQQNMSGGGSGSGGSEGGTGTQGKDTASSDSTTPSDEGLTTKAPPNEQGFSQPSTPNKTITQAQRGVIPPQDNDKIICKLLFKEINSIDDPDMLKGLKEQYTNYKCG